MTSQSLGEKRLFASRRTPHLRQTIYAIGIAFLTFWIALTGLNPKTQLEQILDRGVINFATLRSPLTYYLNGTEPEGLEYKIAKAFAESLGVELRIRVYDDMTHLFRALDDRSTHVVAAGLPNIEPWKNKYLQTGGFDSDRAILIYRQTQGFEPAETLDDLVGTSIEVVAESFSDRQMQLTKTLYPWLRWKPVEGLSELDLLTRLQNRKIDYAVVSNRLWRDYSSYHPELKVALRLGEKVPIGWFTRKHIDDSLEIELQQFFNQSSTEALIVNYTREHKPPVNPLNYFDTLSFRHAVETRYQTLKPFFAEAAGASGFDPLLLASIAYQESHWKAESVSPTGVRGIMMLTEDAASEVGVEDRTDPQQSIVGGAKYLVNVMAKIPERIDFPDRLWFSLAAYNVGYGHLEDARILTQKGGKNPDIWRDVREFLPLLADESVYPETRYGFARGEEPVNYVRNVRAYMKILLTEERLSQMRQLKIDPPS